MLAAMGYQPFANREYRNVFQARLEIPALLWRFPIPEGRSILEIGCGIGVALPRLATLCRPSRLVGVDVERALVTRARERVTRAGVIAELYAADARALPFDDGVFDVVIDFGTCYHIDRPDAALREVARVLREGGEFIHETPLAQLIAHPVRSGKRALPWDASAQLTGGRRALLWASRRKVVHH